MKRFFEKEWVAWTVLALSVIFAVVVGTSKAPKVVIDETGLISSRTVSKIEQYNKDWEKKYNTDIAVMVVENEDEQSMIKRANKRFNKLNLGDNDAVLIVCTDIGRYYFAGGENFAHILADESFRAETGKYFTRGLLDDSEVTGIMFASNIDDVLYEYYGYLDVLFRSGMNPETAVKLDALSEGIEALTDGVGSIVSGSLGAIGNIVGWGFGVVGRIVKWIASLGLFGTIIVIWLCVKFVKKRR